MKALNLYKARDMGTPQRIEQIQDYLQTQADDRFINLIYGMIKAEQEEGLSPEEKSAIDQGLKSISEGNVHSHASVMESTKEKYPNLFK